jgi:hypothetical protein
VGGWVGLKRGTRVGRKWRDIRKKMKEKIKVKWAKIDATVHGG